EEYRIGSFLGHRFSTRGGTLVTDGCARDYEIEPAVIVVVYERRCQSHRRAKCLQRGTRSAVASKGAVTLIQPEGRLPAIRARNEDIEESVVVIIPHRRAPRPAGRRQSAGRGHVAETLRTPVVKENVAAVLVRNEDVQTSLAIEVADYGVARVTDAGETKARCCLGECPVEIVAVDS